MDQIKILHLESNLGQYNVNGTNREQVFVCVRRVAFVFQTLQ